ncbi:MAG: hypothetical protein R3F54_28780 [Alphaproteobacteria bacterium]
MHMLLRAVAVCLALLALPGCDDDENGKGGKVEGKASVTLSDGRVAEITVVVTMIGLAMLAGLPSRSV